MNAGKWCWFLLLFFTVSCGPKIAETGVASYYADKFQGRQTANGQTFKQSKRTAAHRTLPFGTKVTVINLSNGKKVRVKINDRGPFAKGRIIDLSKKAAKKIDMIKSGTATVEIKFREKRVE